VLLGLDKRRNSPYLEGELVHFSVEGELVFFSLEGELVFSLGGELRSSSRRIKVLLQGELKSSPRRIKVLLQGELRNTFAEYMILFGADNRPPMLDKDLYDSWKSRMELYMQNREHDRMILESVEYGSLIWPTIEENGVTKTKKYDELSATFQGSIGKSSTSNARYFIDKAGKGLINDMNIYNMKLEQFQVNTMFLNSLPPEWSKFMTDVKLVKDLHTNNFDQLHAYLQQYEIHANEVRIMREHNQDPLALVANHQMTSPHFNTYQSSYNNPQFQQQFSPPYPQPSQFSPSQSPQYGLTYPTQYYSTTYPSTPLAITYPSTPYPNDYSLIHQEACQQRVVKCFNCQGEGHMERQCPKPKRKREATWFRDKVLLVEAQGNGKVLNKEELEFLADPGIAEGPVT
ncbi:integrase, catalytic region, zinc finger, CCHC-type containing protein, partial [Tanacetum coccineum]